MTNDAFSLPASPIGSNRLDYYHEQSREPAERRGRQLVVRCRAGAGRRQHRGLRGRNPRHHRPQRRRQDLAAQRHQRRLSPPAGPPGVHGPAPPAQPAALSRRPPGHRAHLSERGVVQGHEHPRQPHDRARAAHAQRPAEPGAVLGPRAARGGRAPGVRRAGDRLSGDRGHSQDAGRAPAVRPAESASSWAAPWPPSRACCCSTNPWPA